LAHVVWTVGGVRITRVVEFVMPFTFDFFAEATPADIAAEPSLVPEFIDSRGRYLMSLQTFVIETGDRRIVVDTCVGNSKGRPLIPEFDHQNRPFLADLAAAGFAPDTVDTVVCTHLHVDHVGWNTRLQDGNWVPTFPNATYLVPRADFDFWNPADGHDPALGSGSENVFADSVAPVFQAGQTLLWEDEHVIDDDLRLFLAPGHTPGSSVLSVESGTDRALLVGDLLHTAAQFVEPDANSCFCEDPVAARSTRRRLLSQAADTNTLVLPAHLGGHGGAEVVRDGEKFAIKAWAPFDRI
jgi:glyoxylase-like metal-dependent hydrolase (beta-lactamase superfamily II)